ncbi:MAG TPA: hypothetical protein VFN67_37420 [Polyangiales bacterium]|nr:hypothetical protein [Polyangiales bacterium]
MTAEATPENDLIDPFNCLPPTRGNFLNAAAALVYYEARLHKARRAHQLLEQASVLARAVVEHAQAAAVQVRSLSRVELLKLGMTAEAIAELATLTDAPEKLSAALAPMAHTFTAAAQVYGERAKMLETAVAALLKQATAESALS